MHGPSPISTSQPIFSAASSLSEPIDHSLNPITSAARTALSAPLREETSQVIFELTQKERQLLEEAWQRFQVLGNTVHTLLVMEMWQRLQRLSKEFPTPLSSPLKKLSEAVLVLHQILFFIKEGQRAIERQDTSCPFVAHFPSVVKLKAQMRQCRHHASAFMKACHAVVQEDVSRIPLPVLPKKKTVANFQVYKAAEEAHKRIKELKVEQERCMALGVSFEQFLDTFSLLEKLLFTAEGTLSPHAFISLQSLELRSLSPPMDKKVALETVYTLLCFYNEVAVASRAHIGLVQLCVDIEPEKAFLRSLLDKEVLETKDLLDAENLLLQLYEEAAQTKKNFSVVYKLVQEGRQLPPEWQEVGLVRGDALPPEQLQERAYTLLLSACKYCVTTRQVMQQFSRLISFQLVQERFTIDQIAFFLLNTCQQLGWCNQLERIPRQSYERLPAESRAFLYKYGIQELIPSLDALIDHAYQTLFDELHVGLQNYYHHLGEGSFYWIHWKVNKKLIEELGLPILKQLEAEFLQIVSRKYEEIRQQVSHPSFQIDDLEELECLDLLFRGQFLLEKYFREWTFLMQPRALQQLCRDRLQPQERYSLPDEPPPNLYQKWPYKFFFPKAFIAAFPTGSLVEAYVASHPIEKVKKEEGAPLRTSKEKREEKKAAREAVIVQLLRRRQAHASLPLEEEPFTLEGKKSRHLIRSLVGEGFSKERQVGSHQIFRSLQSRKIVVVPDQGELPAGTKKSIARQVAAALSS